MLAKRLIMDGTLTDHRRQSPPLHWRLRFLAFPVCCVFLLLAGIFLVLCDWVRFGVRRSRAREARNFAPGAVVAMHASETDETRGGFA